MKPREYTKTGKTDLLKVEILCTFDGSTIVLTYHFKIIDELIQPLKITE
ncbi:hypothetical protein C7447_103369 [Tenacibaculum adriaticum]|uniref:Uncharacterized protein n=1 Tax=Tenacibaculum adriaticum TaxID=413713 RepID=A0A5S5DU93_9FLAO|nr:hypothetical protein [Tenacibaculum adriaticum]TYP98199.1 hypothetical protein C7447_103369 [Tenacibaculum adriaticum]